MEKWYFTVMELGILQQLQWLYIGQDGAFAPSEFSFEYIKPGQCAVLPMFIKCESLLDGPAA